MSDIRSIIEIVKIDAAVLDNKLTQLIKGWVSVSVDLA